MENTDASTRSKARFSLRRPVVLLAAGLMLLVSGSGASAQETTDVQVGGNPFRFTPDQTTVEEGDTVTFTWAGGTHNVTFDDGVESETTADQGTNFERTFDEAGTFDFVCTVHPSAMTGSITVTAASSETDTTEETEEADAAPAETGDATDDDASDADEEMAQPESVDAGQAGFADQGIPTLVVALMVVGLFALVMPAVALARRRR